MLADTIAHVATTPLTKLGAGRLEVSGILPTGVVGSSEIGRAGDQLRHGTVDSLEDGLGKLASGIGLVGGLVGRQGLLPALGKLAGETALEVSRLGLVLLAILFKELLPLGLNSRTLGSGLVVVVVDLLGDVEGLLGVETELGLDLCSVVGLEGVAVHTVGALELGTETNDGGELDDRRLVLDILCLLDGGLDALEVVVTVLDPLCVPAVGLEASQDIFGESDGSVTVFGKSGIVLVQRMQ